MLDGAASAARRLAVWVDDLLPSPFEGASVTEVRIMLAGVAAATAVMLVLYVLHTNPRRRYEAALVRRQKTQARAVARAAAESQEQQWRWSAALEHSSVQYRLAMSNEDHIKAMLRRFRDRADAVKRRNLPPVGGEQRAAFVNQAKLDYHDFALISDAKIELTDGVLTLRVDLRPDGSGDGGSEASTMRYSGNPPRT